MSPRYGKFTVIAFLGFLAGCSQALVGTWENAGGSEDQAFVIQSATFKDDGSYVAAAKKGDEAVPLRGTWEFNGMELKLKSPGKPERVYKATYQMIPPMLHLQKDSTKQTLKKKP